MELRVQLLRYLRWGPPDPAAALKSWLNRPLLDIPDSAFQCFKSALRQGLLGMIDNMLAALMLQASSEADLLGG